MSSHEGMNRRKFVSYFLTAGAGGAIVGSAFFVRLGHAATEEEAEEDNVHLLHGEYDLHAHYWGFIVDTTLCIGCGSCVRACSKENKVPEGSYRTWVERFEITKDRESRKEKVNVESPDGAINSFAKDGVPAEEPILKSFFVPKLCNHCEASACTQVCPVGATFESPDGVVLIDRKHCMGCGYCIQACPYGCRFMNYDLGVADKCTLCYHRITRGLPTACVQACPVGARAYGDLNDADSPVRKKLRERRYGLLKPDLGTKPKCFYIGLDLEVI